MESTMLLDTYLKQLQLTTFLRNYHKFAEDAASANLNYDRYLLALAEQEIAQRERNRQLRLMKEAHLPVNKELADFDFTLLPQLNKAQVLELTKGHYIRKAEPILLIGNPGLGKTHLAIALSLLACRQGHKVRFFNAAGLVNELIQAQTNIPLPDSSRPQPNIRSLSWMNSASSPSQSLAHNSSSSSAPLCMKKSP